MATKKTENPYKEGGLQGEAVGQRQRIAMGAWIDGMEYKEQPKATMAKANSDHGDFEKSSIKKGNS
jgi:hypothetical protein